MAGKRKKRDTKAKPVRSRSKTNPRLLTPKRPETATEPNPLVGKSVRARSTTEPPGVTLAPPLRSRTTAPRGVPIVTQAPPSKTAPRGVPVVAAPPSRAAESSATQPTRSRSSTKPYGLPIVKPARSRGKTIALPPKPSFERGQWVTFSTMPSWVSRLPQQSQDVFAYCFGRRYRIEDITPDGMLVLDVSADVDHEFGGFMNDIRVEPECVLPAPS